MAKTKLVCFDLDHTLIIDIHSVMFLSKINNNFSKLIEIEKQEKAGVFDWIEADHYKAKLAKGIHINEIKNDFDKHIKPINKIKETIGVLNKMDIATILITAGPKQVAKIASEKWKIDDFHGSDYEVKDKVFTGKILDHIGDKGKVSFLKSYCQENDFFPEECIAIGDGASDIPLFDYCGTSIAINYSENVIGKATYYLETTDLSEILKYIN